MANAIIININNEEKIIDETVKKVENACYNVIPDHMKHEKPYIKINGSVIAGLTYLNNAVNITENGILLGNVFKEFVDTWDNISCDPDGSFAIFRWNKQYVELLSDVVGTRTIWYYFDDDFFIASTSQRMIVSFLGNYEANIDVIPWMMSTGTLGPYLSWDKRIKFLYPDAKLIFRKQNCKIEVVKNKCVFQMEQGSKGYFKKKLDDSINKAFSSLKFNSDRHYLPLSGGYDSRAILLYFNNKSSFKTITWGEKGSENLKYTDASIAKLLASYYNTTHNYMEINDTKVSFNTVLERFIKNGEGRIDHLSGYLDGFELWKNLKEIKVEGLIRGDEGFGWVTVNSKQNVLNSVGILTLNEYKNLPAWLKEMFSEHRIPEPLTQQKGESLSTWRDRLYHTFRIPIILAALTQLKSGYVEIFNPLISKLIITEVRKLPDKYRNEKSLFKEIINIKSPNIPYAKYSSTVNIKTFLKKKEVVRIFLLAFQNNKGEFISKEITEFLIDKITNKSRVQTSNIKTKLFNMLIASMPNSIKNFIKKIRGKKIDYHVLAFRVYIILRMQEILKSDAKLNKEL